MNRNNFELSHLGRRPRKRRVDVVEGEEIAKGTEAEVVSAEIHYENHDRIVGGLVLKRLRGAKEHPEFSDFKFEDILDQWRYIKEAARRRSKEGKYFPRLPETIREYRRGEERGLLMTDLSEGGEKQVFDLKDIEFIFPVMDESTWIEIRNQVERDIEFADEERVELGGGPSSLDSWLVVLDGDEAKVYIGDIGAYTSVRASDRTIQRSTAKIRKALEKMDEQILKRLQTE